MDWTSIIIAALALPAGGFIFQAIDRVRYKKQNKELKNNEVKGSSAETEEKQINNDSAQIDLGMKFMESTLEQTQKMQQMMLESDRTRNEYWEKQEEGMKEIRRSLATVNIKVEGIEDKVDKVDKRVTSLDKQVTSLTEEVGQMGDFLNGEFAEYKRRRKKPVPKSKKVVGAEKKIEIKIEK